MEPMINKEGNRWKYTCPECLFVPDKNPIIYYDEDEKLNLVWRAPDPDYITTDRISKRTGERGKMPLNFPHRCNECKRKYRRSTRMAKRIDRVWEVAKSNKQRGLQRPKLITFALPSEWFDETSFRTMEEEVAKLEKLLPKARTILQSNGVRGGTYVVECTYKWMPDLENFTSPKHKYHAHVHMVAIAPFVHKLVFKEWCEQLMEIGLGRINYEAPKYRRAVSEYISKYLVKDGRTSRTFGVMRGRKSTTPQSTESPQ